MGQARILCFRSSLQFPGSMLAEETAMSNSNPEMNPGDEAAPGTPGTGEDICPTCHGNGRVEAKECETCGGSGKVTRAIGGA